MLGCMVTNLLAGKAASKDDDKVQGEERQAVVKYTCFDWES